MYYIPYGLTPFLLGWRYPAQHSLQLAGDNASSAGKYSCCTAHCFSSPFCDDEVDEGARGEDLRPVVGVREASLEVEPERRVVLAVLPAHAQEEVAPLADHGSLEIKHRKRNM